MKFFMIMINVLFLLLFIACGLETSVTTKTTSGSTPSTNGKIIEYTSEQKTLQNLKKMGYSFDGKHPILKEHLNQKSMVTFIGKKLAEDSSYLKIITEKGIENYARMLFQDGMIKNPDSRVVLTIRNHREFGGFQHSYGLISTSSDLQIAATFSKDAGGKKQAGLMIVVHNDVGTAIDINGIYSYYNVKPIDERWDKEQEFARVKKIPGKDILGFYFINENGIVSPFFSNTASIIQWRDEPTLEKVQEIWKNAERQIN